MTQKKAKKNAGYLKMRCIVVLVCSYFFHGKVNIVLNLFLNFEQKRASCSYKIVLMKNYSFFKSLNKSPRPKRPSTNALGQTLKADRVLRGLAFCLHKQLAIMRKLSRFGDSTMR